MRSEARHSAATTTKPMPPTIPVAVGPTNGFAAPTRNMVGAETQLFTAPWASEFFDCDVLMGLLDEHYEGKAQNQRKIYTPLVFLIWYKRYFIDE